MGVFVCPILRSENVDFLFSSAGGDEKKNQMNFFVIQLGLVSF